MIVILASSSRFFDPMALLESGNQGVSELGCPTDLPSRGAAESLDDSAGGELSCHVSHTSPV